MCEAKVYVQKDDDTKLLMEDVVSITPDGSNLILRDILGKSKTVEAKNIRGWLARS